LKKEYPLPTSLYKREGDWGLPLWKRGIEGDFNSILWNLFIKLKCYLYINFLSYKPSKIKG
jgi:hypothetical protein